jgi:hypothetical protein
MMDRLVKKALKTTETVKILYFPKIVFLNRFSGTVLAFIKKRKTFTRGGDTMRNLFKHLVAAAVVGVLSANVFAATTIVYSNNPAPGDLFSNSGSAFLGQAVGTSGWYYNNVRYGGEVGIRTNYPFNGNGSVYMRTPTGAAKADIEFLVNAVPIGGNFVSTGVIAPLSQLQSVSYSWYRDNSANPVSKHLHPVLRILLDADGNLNTLGDRGGLVWESVYQLGPSYTAPTNTWVTQTIDDSSWLWNFGLGGTLMDIDGDGYPHNSNLAAWKANFPNAVIIGFNMGLGSGWNGDFVGAVDNISWTIEGITTTTNFEVVPEPTTMALFGLGLLGAAGGLLRRKSA